MGNRAELCFPEPKLEHYLSRLITAGASPFITVSEARTVMPQFSATLYQGGDVLGQVQNTVRQWASVAWYYLDE